MPKEIFDKMEFIDLSKKASKCFVKEIGDTIKLKLRTKRYSYTITLPLEEGKDTLNKLTCDKINL
jgi:hypothetical protein